MTVKERIYSIFITIILSVFCLIPLFEFKIYAKEVPQNLYRVYLNGKSIGIIKSKEKLEKYINEEQKDLKEEYGVDNVYPPNELYISEYKSYDGNIMSEEDIYKIIKDKANFTIKGYKVSVKKDDSTITVNILNKGDFKNSITNVVKAFVSNEDLEVFLSGENVVISGLGKKIEDLYIKEDMTIKEAYISSEEKIFLNEKELTKYLLFGNENTESIYTVKAGDTIESIAENNKLAVEELLVVNQDLKSKKNLLSIGQQISVALIAPVVTVVVEEHLVEEKTIAYTTDIEYDSTMTWGTTRIKQEGKDGKQIVTQKIKYENGDIFEAVIVPEDTKVIEEAIKRIKVIGTLSSVNIDPSEIPDSGDWYWPTLTPYIISSPYGWRWGTLHDGTDITGTGYGSPIFAANNGVVTKVFYDSTGGNQIYIAHANNIYTVYAHLSKQLVKVGQTVTRGQKIGEMGSTGFSTGTHLHFATWKGVPYRGTSFNSMSLYR